MSENRPKYIFLTSPLIDHTQTIFHISAVDKTSQNIQTRSSLICNGQKPRLYLSSVCWLDVYLHTITSKVITLQLSICKEAYTVLPCTSIAIIVNDDQQDATILAYLFIHNQLYMFRGCLRPSSGALDCIYSFWYYPPTLLLAGVMDEVEFHLIHDTSLQQHRWTISETANTVKGSWWLAKTARNM